MPVMSKEQAYQLSVAIRIAAAAHESQRDKRGEAYILHPLRVMARVKSPEEKMMAVLHDIIEDCNMSPGYLLNVGIPDDVIKGIVCLSRVEVNGKPERYIDSFIKRIAECGDLRIVRVKRADLKDNLDPNRVPPDAVAHESLQRKYRRAYGILGAVLSVDRLEKSLKKARELL